MSVNPKSNRRGSQVNGRSGRFAEAKELPVFVRQHEPLVRAFVHGGKSVSSVKDVTLKIPDVCHRTICFNHDAHAEPTVFSEPPSGESATRWPVDSSVIDLNLGDKPEIPECDAITRTAI